MKMVGEELGDRRSSCSGRLVTFQNLHSVLRRGDNGTAWRLCIDKEVTDSV